MLFSSTQPKERKPCRVAQPATNPSLEGVFQLAGPPLGVRRLPPWLVVITRQIIILPAHFPETRRRLGKHTTIQVKKGGGEEEEGEDPSSLSPPKPSVS